MKTYKVNEIFYSLQGEGVRAGTPHVFVRFAGCNLQCRQEIEGFDCDTEFSSYRPMTLDELIGEVISIRSHSQWVLLTGGEPSLQVDEALLDRLHEANFKIAIETNGTRELSPKIDWICVSPKTAEHTLRQDFAHEVKYVRSHGMGIPKPKIKADHYLISPAFDPSGLPQRNLDWCLRLVKENPNWRISVQQHKLWGIR